MKKAFLILPLLAVSLSLSSFDYYKPVASSFIQDGPSPLEIGSALKQALQQGTSKSADKLSALNGFFGNAEVKILFPPEARDAEKALRDIGLNDLCDKVI